MQITYIYIYIIYELSSYSCVYVNLSIEIINGDWSDSKCAWIFALQNCWVYKEGSSFICFIDIVFSSLAHLEN